MLGMHMTESLDQQFLICQTNVHKTHAYIVTKHITCVYTCGDKLDWKPRPLFGKGTGQVTVNDSSQNVWNVVIACNVTHCLAGML